MTTINVGDDVIAVRDAVYVDKGKAYSVSQVVGDYAYVLVDHNKLVGYPTEYFMPVITKLVAPVKPTPPSVAADLRITPKARVILRHLKAGKQITPSDALVVYGQSRLAACIYEIRQAGYKVKTERAKDESGHGYSRYSLVI